MNVLIISASMGAGHDGAARELQRRLRRDGHAAEVQDYLTAFPVGIGRAVRLSYQWELRLAPWTYEATYRLWYLLPVMAAPLVSLLALLTNWKIRRWVEASGADVVVSTYPLASLTLGRMRRRGRLPVPVSTYITDFAVHPLWAAPGVDLHMAVHPRSAATAHEQTGAPASAPGPLVSDQFTAALPDRSQARAALGIAPDQRVVLLVAGSWGVGAVRRTFHDVLATGTWLPLAVCGRNDRLRRRLSARGAGWVYGWTDQMPTLMAAADVLVENAGGLTCMEAFAAGLPVVSYRPIAGHGKGNAKDMEAAGVAALAHPSDLLEVLDATLGPEGAERRAAGRRMFAGDAAADIVELGAQPAPVPAARPASVEHPHPVRARLRPAMVAATAVLSLALGIGMTSVGSGIAAATGLAAHPPKHSTSVYLAVRLGPAAITDPRVPAALAADHVTAIVSGQLAAAYPGFVAELASDGCDVANGGWGHHRGLPWAPTDISRSGDAIRDATGGAVHILVPGRAASGFELASAKWENETVVLTHALAPTVDAASALRPGQIYVLDAR
ncbi:MAG TPA: glycosyltransferase, partial [Acidimicrobiales bacterium]